MIQDIYQESGPLAGIHAALLQAQSQWVFVTACDMPYLELAYLDFMMERLQEGSYAVCVTERGGRPGTLSRLLQPFGPASPGGFSGPGAPFGEQVHQGG